MKKAPREAEPKEAKKKDPEFQNVLSAQGLGIYELIVGTLSRAKGRRTM
jgi:hypothetical protein